MRMLVLTLLTFKKGKLFCGHPVPYRNCTNFFPKFFMNLFEIPRQIKTKTVTGSHQTMQGCQEWEMSPQNRGGGGY